jgi:hypothetical protein
MSVHKALDDEELDFIVTASVPPTTTDGPLGP